MIDCYQLEDEAARRTAAFVAAAERARLVRTARRPSRSPLAAWVTRPSSRTGSAAGCCVAAAPCCAPAQPACCPA